MAARTANSEQKTGSRKKPAKGKEKTARLVLLDSHAIIHRAYHALPDFSSSKGEPTGALYGLVTMLLKIAQELKPEYFIAARDLPGKTHRHEAYEAYKGTRAEADPELIEQLKRAPEVFKAFGIPLYEAPGFEADDVIGTIAKHIDGSRGIDVVIASGDLDTLQLVSPHVRVYTLRKGMNDTILYDEEAVHERYGFGPEHIVDYKALRGDPSDNIPGVKGIGEKTATELIKEYGAVEDIYTSLARDRAAFEKKAKPRIAALLEAGKKDAAFSKQLATIHTEAPIEFALPEERWTLAANAGAIEALCSELEFRSLRARVRGLTGMPPDIGAVEDGPSSSEAIDPVALRETSIALWLLHSDTTNPSLDDILAYAKTDEFGEAREKICAELATTGRLQEVYDRIEKPLIPVIERMNAAGVHLDTEHLKELATEYGKELATIAARIFEAAGHEFNINSPKQLAGVLYDELKVSATRQKLTAGGARTTRESELAKLADEHAIVADVLSYRELQKLLSTYIEKMPGLVGKDGRLHAEFVQAGTTTGRMSSQDPNLQNIPVKTAYGRRIREAFAAERGNVLVAIDYSQVELRIAAGLSGDEKLVEVFKRGEDVHTAVAARVFGVPPEQVDYEMRRRAKVINFGILYGMGVNALKQNLGGEVSRAEAEAFLDAYFTHYAGLAAFIEKTKREAEAKGYTETLFGRRRYFPGFASKLPQLKAQAERMATNAPMQGTQSDIIKLAMVEADRLIEKEGWRPSTGSGQADVRLVMQVHDELIYEVRAALAEEAAQKIRQVMETVVPASALHGVPIVAEVEAGKTWGSLKKL